MEVLHLSMPRTGTVSMQKALAILGIRLYHGGGTTLKRPSDTVRWMQAAKAKFNNQGPRFQLADWDQLLGDFGAAKVILIQRDAASWAGSFRGAFGRLHDWRTVLIAQLDRWSLRPYRGMMLFVADNFFEGSPMRKSKESLEARYDEYYSFVRSITPADQLLEYQMGSGWEPLCSFLGKPIPKQPFPHANDRRSHSEKFNRTANVAVTKWSVLCLGSIAQAWALLYYRHAVISWALALCQLAVGN
ncbi:hypothetical protein ANOM_007549 [Aspergillus nomiae NRRL 13137]|uniref:NAD dependent epimerase/dehydratase n=1 Tax=Aspergillus nomiae NRRL (strain ATCC 15546 / NRRL 13137 / CBS 260.88 / M93) TaxID=1509407 RepID=A0A0L1IZG6_ASPN3|nr:uncharacterized protein ANOM_007549 [Aspergillus nomiae NRRL 13137]KNG84815.1 hypothetical protein ANOM_007549 [Aspergillus nomiae NRRL 13137]